MGAEGKYDLKLAAGYDPEANAAASGTTSASSPTVSTLRSMRASTSESISSKGGSGGNAVSSLTGRKSSSTPSLPEATEGKTASVASTEQAASADNIVAKVNDFVIYITKSLSLKCLSSYMFSRQQNWWLKVW